MTDVTRRLSPLPKWANNVLTAILTCLMIFAAPALAMDVRHDLGGSVKARLEQIRGLASRGTPVRIVGTCVSACTLYLGLPNACVMPDARLGFHGPTTRLRGIPLPREEFDRVSQQMAAHYPEPLRRWFLAEARMRTVGYVKISGRQAIAMGARACD
jgi:hypothetical protein